MEEEADHLEEKKRKTIFRRGEGSRSLEKCAPGRKEKDDFFGGVKEADCLKWAPKKAVCVCVCGVKEADW